MLFPHGPAGAASSDGEDRTCAPVILVVEDNHVMQRVARLQLEELGYRVEIAHNGVEALGCLERYNYDLILMDCQMDEMDGFEATKRIRESDAARGSRMTIIALTTQGLASDRQKCLDTGMDDFLLKPVGKDQMKKMLDKWLVHSPRRPAS
jgi:CheY-like chemotaxis protein